MVEAVGVDLVRLIENTQLIENTKRSILKKHHKSDFEVRERYTGFFTDGMLAR